MKRLLFLFLLISTSIFAQIKKITLDDLWTDYTFRTEGLESFHSMKNGDFYTILNNYKEGTWLDKYDYATLKKVKTIVSGNDLAGIKYFEDYTFNKEETRIIIGTNLDRIFRHSKVGIYYVYEIASKKLIKISEDKIMEPTFSPDGNKVAFAYKNNLFIKNLKSAKTTQITFDGEKNKIINGITDWVYEEEFSFVRAFEWNGNSDKIAFIRFDESEVPEFTMDIYGKDLYPKQQVFKYPKAGEKNSIVDLFIYNLNSQKSTEVNLGQYKQYYLPRMQWTNENNTLAARQYKYPQNID